MTSLAKKTLLWGTVIFLMFILLSAIRFGIAELFSFSANQSMQQWNASAEPPSLTEIDSVASQLKVASFLLNNDPANHENIARLSLIRASLANIPLAEKREILQQGLTEIHHAISLRPISPYSWTLLLLLKRDLAEFDDEFKHALHRAVELGTWEPALLTELGDIGLSAWEFMPPAEQMIIQQVFVRGVQRQSQLMGDVVQAHLNECAEPNKQKAGCAND